MQPGGSDIELDIEDPNRLLAYLRATGRIGADEEPKIELLFGGVSNRTVLLTRPSGEAWVLKQALAQLRVAVEWFSDPARIDAEALGIRYLSELAPPRCIPPLIFHDPVHHLLAMAAVPQPHDNLKKLWLAGRLEPWHVEQLGTMLGTIHRRAWQRRDELQPLFAERRFYEELRLEAYFGYTATQVPEAAAFMHRLIDDTRSRTITVVHGDYSPKNVLVHDHQLVLLDHEVIHWGDPAFDCGFCLTHVLSKAHHLPDHRRRFIAAAAEFWAAYARAIGDVPWADGLEQVAVRQTLGCLLARVRGRSPLEYLDGAQRDRQAAAVTAVMTDPPGTIAELSAAFIAQIESN